MNYNKSEVSVNDRICKRCLTRELAEQFTEQGENFQNLWEYIENLDRDVKTSKELYEERLSICKECDFLFQGMCRGCGCYVELRAAVTKNSCPYKRW